MNLVVIQGRLCRDPEVRYSTGDKATAIANFSMAVDRRFKREGEPDADFFNLTAFGKSAEIAEKYLRKGTKITVLGELRNETYEKDGQKRTATKIIVSQFDFCESKATATAAAPAQERPKDGFINIPDGIDDEVPFA